MFYLSIVLDKPVHKKPVHAKVDQAYGYLGGEVNLTCEAVAEPAANFTWYRQHRKSVAGRIIQEPHWSILQVLLTLVYIFTYLLVQVLLFLNVETVLKRAKKKQCLQIFSSKIYSFYFVSKELCSSVFS